MTSMIEKMARAMAVTNNDYDGDYLCWSAYEDDARAALQAMLEPSEDMVEAGEVVICGYEDMRSARNVMAAMIRAALEDK